MYAYGQIICVAFQMYTLNLECAATHNNRCHPPPWPVTRHTIYTKANLDKRITYFWQSCNVQAILDQMGINLTKFQII